jgi:uncharacterized protein (DUF488 family)
MAHDQITLYSVGHSNRSTEELIEILAQAEIETLVDVRAQPRSTRHPQFNEDVLRGACERASIVYHWAGRHLGGLRTARADSPHTALAEEVRGFADHMGGDAFKKAAAQLLHMAARTPTAMLCAERDPQQCHRALIADYLLLQGARVLHLIEPGDTREHLLSAEVRRESAELIYDRQVTGHLDFGDPVAGRPRS